MIQGDADSDLADYPDGAFDYAILSPDAAGHAPAQGSCSNSCCASARHAIVSFPNFGHWKVRLQLLFNGRMPVTWNLPETWYDTPNIHLCTIRDFRDLCEVVGARIERSFALSPNGHPLGSKIPAALHNLVAQQAVFLLTREPGKGR